MQHNSKHIILTDSPMVWRLSFTYDDIYALVSTETAYDDHRSTEANGTKQLMMDDDRPLFDYYLSIAISDLTGLLVRRMAPRLGIRLPDGRTINNSMVESTDSVTFCLLMDDNHEEQLLASMHRYCTDFLAKRVPEMWYRKQGLSDSAKASIIKVLEFRRKPVRRPIRNFL